MQKPDINNDTKIGQYLRAQREQRGISIEQIASATKINVKLLHALESDQFDHLPARPFVRGFITNYSKYLGLDPIIMVDHYEANFKTAAPQNTRIEGGPAAHVFIDSGSNTDKSRTVLSIVMGTCLVLGLIFLAFFKPSHKKKHHGAELAEKQNSTVVVTTGPSPSPSTAPLAVNTTQPGTAANITSTTPAPTTVAAPAPAAMSDAKPTVAPVQSPVHTSHSLAPEVSQPPRWTPPQTPLVLAPVKSIEATKSTMTSQTNTNTNTGTGTGTATSVAKEVITKSNTNTGTSTNTAPTSAIEAKLPPIPANEVKHVLIIRAKEDSWIKYQSDDRKLMGYVLKKEKTIYVKARENIRFTSGNPKGVEYSINGGPFATFKDQQKSLILPKEAESKFLGKMFIE